MEYIKEPVKTKVGGGGGGGDFWHEVAKLYVFRNKPVIPVMIQWLCQGELHQGDIYSIPLALQTLHTTVMSVVHDIVVARKFTSI